MHPKNIAGPLLSLVRKNLNAKHSTEDVLNALEEKYFEACTLSDERVSRKNLLYFTLNANKEYIKLFEYCINSIFKQSVNTPFDVLIYCPKEWEMEIRDVLNKANVPECVGIHLEFVSYTDEGIKASMVKLQICKYARIKEYGRVLYLDTDILAQQSMDYMWMTVCTPGYLHACIHVLAEHLHGTVFHSLRPYTMGEMNRFKENRIHAFNAGQFMFDVSDRMIRHMENVLWLSEEWPDDYFFEQSFMNHYFNIFGISDVYALLGRVRFIAIMLGKGAMHFPGPKVETAALLHFAGHACDAQQKEKFMLEHFRHLIYERDTSNGTGTTVESA